MAYRVSWRRRWVRGVLRWVFRGVFRLLFRLRFEGWEHLPREGGYLVVYNHVSILEPPLLLAFWPRQAEAVAAVEVFQRSFQRTLVRWYAAIPVRRGVPDRRLLDTLVAVLRSGLPLLLAPEGGRSHRPGLRRAWTGVAYVVDRAQVPVVPVGVVGSTDEALKAALRFRRPRIEVRIGEPFTLPPLARPGVARKEARRANADAIMYRIAALLPPAYRGVYGEPAAEAGE